MSSCKSLDQLIDALTRLPGVGQKSAQRMALHLLDRDRDGAGQIVNTLKQALASVQHCQQCRNYSDNDVCAICANPKRSSRALCVVETPADVLAIESSQSFDGQYFVLFGKLSPMDGVGPEQLGIDVLENQFKQGNIEEVILATNPNVEGEITARFIADLAQQYDIRSTRIAYGVPMGGELEYVDSGTLMRAFSGRQNYQA